MSTEQEYPRGGRIVGRSESAHATTDDYDMAWYHIAASDDHGHSVVIRVDTSRMPIYMQARIQEYVELPASPYANVSEFLRDAAYHRLHQLDELFAAGVLPTRMAELMAKADRLKQEADSWQERLDSLEKKYDIAMSSRNDELLLVVLEAAREGATEAIPAYRESFERFYARISNLPRFYADATESAEESPE